MIFSVIGRRLNRVAEKEGHLTFRPGRSCRLGRSSERSNFAEAAIKSSSLPVRWINREKTKPAFERNRSDMVPCQNTIEERLTPKELALLLDPEIGKTGLPKKYSTAIRLLQRYGGHRVLNDNPNYELREISSQRAEEILVIERERRAKRRGC